MRELVEYRPEFPVTVGDQVGRVVGGPAGSTVMHQNVAGRTPCARRNC
jgi:hypothetical protein